METAENDNTFLPEVMWMMDRRWRAMTRGLLFLMLTLLSGCAVNPVTGQNELMLLSEQDERQLGLQAEQSVVKEYGVYADTALQAYVNGVAQPLARVSHRPTLDWHFQVMDSPVVNAFAAPGGYVFITRGLLAAVNDEAELAGVLAHEIGHVTARHSAHQYSQSMLAGLGVQLGTALVGDYGNIVGSLLEAGTGLLFLKYSRDDERQSDSLGVEYATRAGYNTNRMADFFGTLQRQGSLDGGSGGDVPEWFSSHPSSVDRETAVRSQTLSWQSRFPGQLFRVNRDIYLNRVDGLVFGDDPRRGYREGDWFYLPQYQVQFRIPAQWSFDREGSQAQMAHPQKAGVILFVIQEGSVDSLAKAFVAKMRAQVQQSANQTIHGMRALRLLSVVTDGQKRARIVSHFFQRGNEVVMFHGLAGEAGFARLESTLEQPATSFAPLTDRDKLNRQPQRIAVKQIGKATTLEGALQTFKVDSKLWPRIAWLNERQLSDRLQSGEKIKIIE
jgi:predicted Zn-dependent protease